MLRSSLQRLAFSLQPLVFAVLLVGGARAGERFDKLAQDFASPPNSAKPRVYWWWLNSRVSKEGITRDLEEYRAKGIGGVLLFDAGMPAGRGSRRSLPPNISCSRNCV